ncbi:unnamed protein product, partial [Ectocarpus sp. 12 AP-2014]
TSEAATNYSSTAHLAPRARTYRGKAAARVSHSKHPARARVAMETATSWIAELANALTEALSSPSTAALSTFFKDNEGLSPPPPTWLLALRENAWVLALLAIWVSGC